ncbi:MAG TPA: signal recognition particle-docking protein FtsY [Steroidobacteraceae bacterium]|nr:signal recognition particle-docking protein FtsY [Steroidobacteraceae bacterium]
MPPATPEKAASDAEVRRSFIGRLRQRLNRGDSWLSADLGELFKGRGIDAAILEELETRLISADVGVAATERILAELSRRVARRELKDIKALTGALETSIVEILAPCAQPLVIDPARRPFVILVVGVNGSGKTTTIGKLAQRFTDEGRSVLLAAGDTFRAAAIEQLKTWAERSGALFAAQQAGADPGAVVFDAMQTARARGSELLIADTAGRLQSQVHLMEELKKVKRVIQRIDGSAPHEILLVLDANQGQNALVQARLFNEALGISGIALTKLDGTAKGGIVIAVAQELKIPLRYLGVGETSEDLGDFDARAFAAALVEGPARLASAREGRSP